MAKLNMRHPGRRRIRGMSLVEILVGVLIGLIGIVVIFQVLSVSENRKRTTVHGSDAQSAGAIALYTLQREVQLAGYGFGGAHYKQIGCLVKAFDKGDTTPVPAIPPGPRTFRLYPVEIVQGAAGAPDTLRVVWGNSSQTVTSRAWGVGSANSSGGVPMKAMQGGRAGLDYGDILLLTGDPTATAGPATECVLVQVTDRPTGLPTEVGYDSDYNHVDTGDTLHAAATPTPRFNKDAKWPASDFTPTAGFVFNLGKQPRRLEWTITPPLHLTPNRLMMSETLFGGSIAPVEISDGMINLQAEYGIDRNNNQLIDANEWTETPPNGALPGNPNSPCGENPPTSWGCVRAVRVALLSRSSHWDQSYCALDRPQRTSGATGNLLLTPFEMTNVDGAADPYPPKALGVPLPDCNNPPDPNDWRRYRYSVYETVIPLRNMIWGTAP